MIASTAPATTASTGIKQPTGSQLPPLAFLQGGGQLSDYRFSGLTGAQAQFNGMTLNEVKQVLGNYNQQVQQQFGPKKPDTVTGSSSSDQALGYIGGIGASLGGAYLASGIGKPAATATTTALSGGTTGGSLGNLSLSSALGLGGSTSTAGTGAVPAMPELIGATPATGLGAQLGSTGATLGGGAIGPSALLGGGLVAGAGTGYLQGQGLYNAVRGRDMNIGQEAALALPTMGASFLVDPVRSLFGSKKEGERIARKQGRLGFQNAGLMNQDSRSRYNLADGSQYDISTRPDKKAYNVDWSGDNANRDEQVGLTNVLANALVGGGSKLRSDMSGELYNSYNSNGNFDANIKSAYDRAGGRDAVYGQVAERWKQGQLTAGERDANFAAIDKLYGIKNETGARWEDAANLSDKDKQRNASQLASSVQPAQSSQATTKPLPQKPQTLSQESINNGGRPAPTNLTPTFRPGASANPNFKAQNNGAKNPSLAKKAGEKMAKTVNKKKKR